MNGEKPPAGHRYHCRGCGGPLPAVWHGQFHPECLKRDKQLRIQEKRRLERERLLTSLEREHCPQCGTSLSAMKSRIALQKRGANHKDAAGQDGLHERRGARSA